MKRSILPDSLECKLDIGVLESFDKAEDGSYRMIKVIVNEKKALELSECRETISGSPDWKDNYDQYISEAVDLKSPCFIFYRLDEKNKATGQYLWLLISWSPVCVSNKQRTIYALCKSTLIHKFSGGQIKDNIFASEKSELKLESYMEYISEPKPLSDADKSLIFLDENENIARVEHAANFKILPGLNLPVDAQVLTQLNLFKLERCNYIQLIIDQKGEQIMLEKTFDKLDISQLPNQIPLDRGRFHLYRFSHIFEDLPYKSLVFIYSMPGFACTVRERMMYSSCKSELVSYLKSQHICPIKTLEISEPNELTKEFLIDELHPKKYVIFKKENSTENSFSSKSAAALAAHRRVTFHEDTKADDSWINEELRQERELKKKKGLQPRSQSVQSSNNSNNNNLPPVNQTEETFIESIMNSVLHNNLFYVLLFGLILLSISTFTLRILKSALGFI